MGLEQRITRFPAETTPGMHGSRVRSPQWSNEGCCRADLDAARARGLASTSFARSVAQHRIAIVIDA